LFAESFSEDVQIISLNLHQMAGFYLLLIHVLQQSKQIPSPVEVLTNPVCAYNAVPLYQNAHHSTGKTGWLLIQWLVNL